MSDSSATAEQHPSASKVLPSGVEILSVVLRGLRYYEDAGPESEEAFDDQWPEPGTLNFIGEINVRSAETVQFSIWVRARIKSDDSVFGVYLGMSAMFLRQPIIRAKPFLSFVNRQGASILYPYVREVVASVSSRTIHGSTVLPPLIIAPLVDEATIEGLIVVLERMMETAPTESTAE